MLYCSVLYNIHIYIAIIDSSSTVCDASTSTYLYKYIGFSSRAQLLCGWVLCCAVLCGWCFSNSWCVVRCVQRLDGADQSAQRTVWLLARARGGRGTCGGELSILRVCAFPFRLELCLELEATRSLLMRAAEWLACTHLTWLIDPKCDCNLQWGLRLLYAVHLQYSALCCGAARRAPRSIRRHLAACVRQPGERGAHRCRLASAVRTYC